MKLRTSVLLAAVALVPAAAQAQITGPSTATAPYILPSAAGVQTVSILTVGDSIGGYQLAGIPDGMGAYKRGVGTARNFGLVVNHELVNTAGAIHAHGSVGAFVSFWGINPSNKSVLLGRDLATSVVTAGGSTAINRLCSGDLADRVAFFQDATADSTHPYIFLSGEESGAEGRCFAHVVTGAEARTSYELPRLGKFSFENALARPYASTKTVVVATDDTTPGEVYVYIGTKQSTGSVVERAGLANGLLYGVRAVNAGVPVALEDRTTILGGANRFELAGLGDVSAKTGAQLQTDSLAASVTQFLRPEDGCWDPSNPRDFYFVTTDRFNSATQVGRSRLWRLRFDDLANPEAGGALEMLLDGTEGQNMMDNLCIDRRGHLLIQEDPGNQAHVAKIWQYDIAADSLTQIATFDAAQFVSGLPGYVGTQDEESSGIFDASEFLGPGWFLLNAQVHLANPNPALVEGGQLLALYNPASL